MIITAGRNLEVGIVQDHQSIEVEAFRQLISEQTKNRFTVGITCRKVSFLNLCWVNRKIGSFR